MKVVITLRNGVQIRMEVEDFTVSRNRLTSELKGIRWQLAEGATSSVHWIDLAEVVAIHAEHEPGFGQGAQDGPAAIGETTP